MLFEIKPVALKAMVVTVVADVALFSFHSESTDLSHTPIIAEDEASIRGVLDVEDWWSVPSAISISRREARLNYGNHVRLRRRSGINDKGGANDK